MTRLFGFFSFFLFSFFVGGCSGTSSDTEEFNKPEIYWYKKIAESISSSMMDKADGYYISLKSEHIRSPLMPTAMEMLAYAHANKEEYQLANFYLDEYNKQYGEEGSREYIAYLKVKSSFLGIKEVYKDQKLIQDTINAAQEYLSVFGGSEYAVMVSTILTRLQMTQYLLNENVASLYRRTGKQQAAKIYLERNQNTLIKRKDIKDPEVGIVAELLD